MFLLFTNLNNVIPYYTAIPYSTRLIENLCHIVCTERVRTCRNNNSFLCSVEVALSRLFRASVLSIFSEVNMIEQWRHEKVTTRNSLFFFSGSSEILTWANLILHTCKLNRSITFGVYRIKGKLFGLNGHLILSIILFSILRKSKSTIDNEVWASHITRRIWSAEEVNLDISC